VAGCGHVPADDDDGPPEQGRQPGALPGAGAPPPGRRLHPGAGAAQPGPRRPARPDGLRRLVASINRYLGEPDPAAGSDAAAAVGLDDDAAGLRPTASRPAGAAWLLDGLWKALGVDAALRQVLGGRRFSTDVERVLFALVANRAIDPASKLAAAEWASADVAIPELAEMDDDQA
jgi:hypothetical protein